MIFEKLFAPICIGAVEFKNRIVMPAMTTVFANENGAITERLIEYYSERAKGGAGLIVVEATCIDYPQGKISHATQLRIDYDKFVPGLNYLVKAVHRYGAKIALQLHHAGRQTTLGFTEGFQPVSASDVYDSVFDITPKALSINEIEILIEKFGEGARRAKVAGFDAVEIHGAHGYLVQQFLSPYTNRRTDKYGGTLERRMTFAIEILRYIREKVGWSFPVIFRLSAEEHVPGGLTLKDSIIIAQKLENEGVDALHISSGTDETPPEYCAVPPMAIQRGCFVHYAESIKQHVQIPVITVGRINDPGLAEKILRERKADMIAMGRALIADPELPRKTIEGRINEIRKCIACNMCTMRIGVGLPLGCAVNPVVGEENATRITPTSKPKRILIVGGGPAGMEAARVSALKGHEVILFDDNEQLGGQLRLAISPPYKDELKNLLDYLINQLEKLGVEIRLGYKVTFNLIKEINPDAVIVATGARPIIPNIKGINGRNVVTAWDVLAGKADINGEVVIAGGGTVGCETAEFLAEKCEKVTIVEMLDDIALDAEPITRRLLIKRLKEKKVKVLINSLISEIKDAEVLVFNIKKNMLESINIDSVVLALGAIANDELCRELRKVKEFYVIGDCAKPRKIADAIYEGFHTAREI